MILRYIRNLLISLVTILGLARLYRLQMRRKGPLVRVLAFHDVADKAWFQLVIKAIEQRCNIISPDEFRMGVLMKDQINVLLTFDDGYASWIENVLPVLTSVNATGIFFITTGLLDTCSNKETAKAFCVDRLYRSYRPVLSWEGARKLLEDGHVIGGHTHLHPDLTKIDATTLEQEVIANKILIEAKLGIVPTDFAYPFGTKLYYNQTVVDALVEAGYDTAFTATSGYAVSERATSNYEIPRLCIENNLPASMVIKWIGGGYDIVGHIKKILAWLKLKK